MQKQLEIKETKLHFAHKSFKREQNTHLSSNVISLQKNQ